MSEKKAQAVIQNLGEVLNEKPGELAQIADAAREGKAVEENESSLVAIPLEAIPMNVALPCSLYVKVGERYVTYRKQSEKLTPRIMISLQEKKTGTLYIHKAFWRIFTDSLKSMNLPDNTTSDQQATHIRQLFVVYGHELEKKAREPKKPTFDKLQKMAEMLALEVQSDPKLGLKYLRRSEDPIAYFVNHSVNTAVYAALISRKLNYSLDQLKTLTYACLVHDIGNLYLPKSILYKRDILSDEEMAQMKGHPQSGAELLQSLGSSPVVVRVALQHHERMDGKGYPSGISGEAIHPFARICAIADAYDALTSHRPHAKALTVQEALEIMRKDEGKFDPQILAAADFAAK